MPSSAPTFDEWKAKLMDDRVTQLKSRVAELMTASKESDAELTELICPITHCMFRDPVVVDSGHTFDRRAILSHFKVNGAKNPLTLLKLGSASVLTNWAMRNVVQGWLDRHPKVTPDGWDSPELLLELPRGDIRSSPELIYLDIVSFVNDIVNDVVNNDEGTDDDEDTNDDEDTDEDEDTDDDDEDTENDEGTDDDEDTDDDEGTDDDEDIEVDEDTDDEWDTYEIEDTDDETSSGG